MKKIIVSMLVAVLLAVPVSFTHAQVQTQDEIRQQLIVTLTQLLNELIRQLEELKKANAMVDESKEEVVKEEEREEVSEPATGSAPEEEVEDEQSAQIHNCNHVEDNKTYSRGQEIRLVDCSISFKKDIDVKDIDIDYTIDGDNIEHRIVWVQNVRDGVLSGGSLGRFHVRALSLEPTTFSFSLNKISGTDIGEDYSEFEFDTHAEIVVE